MRLLNESHTSACLEEEHLGFVAKSGTLSNHVSDLLENVDPLFVISEDVAVAAMAHYK